MTLLIFLAALGAIVLFAVTVNLVTGTKANYLELLQLEPGETELWRDAGADFATLPRTGQALVMSYPRFRRHTVLWTDGRVIVAQKTLFSSKRMITHQLVFESAPERSLSDARDVAAKFSGGFYGRGFATLVAASHAFATVNRRECVRILPSEASGAALNLQEAYIFSDDLAALRERLSSHA